MNICPQCAYAVERPEVLSPKKVCCEHCSWEGDFKETIYIDEAQVDINKHQAQLEAVYVRLATEVAPTIGKILIETGMVEGPDGKDKVVDNSRVQILANILQGSTRGCIMGIANAITKEANYGRN